MYQTIPVVPNHLLLINHTNVPDVHRQIALFFQLRTDEEIPVIRFAPSRRQNLLGYDTLNVQTKSFVDQETVTTARNITSMLNYAGNIYTTPCLGVCGMDLMTPVEGTITFGGYLHCIEGDIKIKIPENTDLDVISHGNNGVFYNGRRIRKKQRVDPFDEYILERKLREPTALELLAKVKESSSWISSVDLIRRQNKLYLLADNGKVDIEFIEEVKLPDSKRGIIHY